VQRSTRYAQSFGSPFADSGVDGPSSEGASRSSRSRDGGDSFSAGRGAGEAERGSQSSTPMYVASDDVRWARIEAEPACVARAEFVGLAGSRAAAVDCEIEHARRDFVELVRFFGEDPTSTMQSLLGALHGFVRAFAAAREDAQTAERARLRSEGLHRDRRATIAHGLQPDTGEESDKTHDRRHSLLLPAGEPVLGRDDLSTPSTKVASSAAAVPTPSQPRLPPLSRAAPPPSRPPPPASLSLPASPAASPIAPERPPPPASAPRPPLPRPRMPFGGGGGDAASLFASIQALRKHGKE
jgi:hypothetical protein